MDSNNILSKYDTVFLSKLSNVKLLNNNHTVELVVNSYCRYKNSYVYYIIGIKHGYKPIDYFNECIGKYWDDYHNSYNPDSVDNNESSDNNNFDNNTYYEYYKKIYDYGSYQLIGIELLDDYF